MGYWDIIIDEVSKSKKRKNKFSFSKIGIYKSTPKKNIPLKHTPVAKNKRHKKRYYLGNDFSNIYFTEMELTVLIYIFYGKTMPETARILALSKRTVEYYINNMKKRLGCRHITELMREILMSDLEKYVRWDD